MVLKDIDECKENHTCDQICINTNGFTIAHVMVDLFCSMITGTVKVCSVVYGIIS